MKICLCKTSKLLMDTESKCQGIDEMFLTQKEEGERKTEGGKMRGRRWGGRRQEVGRGRDRRVGEGGRKREEKGRWEGEGREGGRGEEQEWRGEGGWGRCYT